MLNKINYILSNTFSNEFKNIFLKKQISISKKFIYILKTFNCQFVNLTRVSDSEILVEYAGNELSETEVKKIESLFKANYSKRENKFEEKMFNIKISFKKSDEFQNELDVLDIDTVMNVDNLPNHLKKYSFGLTYLSQFGIEYFLYCGTNRNDSSVFIKYPKKYRYTTSSFSLNYNNVYMDNAPEWRKFPKRQASVMFTNSINYASTFGTAYFIIPENNAVVGVCPYGDLWSSVSVSVNNHTITLPIFNHVLEILGITYLQRNINNQNYNQFMQDLQLVDNLFINDKKNKYEDLFSVLKKDDLLNDDYADAELNAITTINHIKSNISLVELTKKLLSSDKFKTVIFKPKNFVELNTKRKHEFWTDKPALLIHPSEYLKKK